MSPSTAAITAVIALFAICDGSPVSELPSRTTTENEIGLSNEIEGETSDKPLTPARPKLSHPLQPILKSVHREVTPSVTTTSHTATHFKTSSVQGHTTHKASPATTQPTKDSKVKPHKRCSRNKKDHVVRIHVGTDEIVFFSGACGPKNCVVKKEFINGVMEPGTQL